MTNLRAKFEDLRSMCSDKVLSFNVIVTLAFDLETPN